MEISENKYIKKYQVNLFNWYPFENLDNVLLIGIKSDEIKKNFTEKFCHVEIVNKVSEIKDTTRKYSYIILKDTFMEELNSFTFNHNLFQTLSKHLTARGSILFSFNNLYGSESWRRLELDFHNAYRLEEVMKSMPDKLFKNKKVYYPFPSHEYPNIIFTKEYLPNISNLDKNVGFSKEGDSFFYPINYKLNQFLKQDMYHLDYIANSYLIELTNASVSDINFVSFHNLRETKYQLQTTFDGVNFSKKANSEESQVHINNMKQIIDKIKQVGLKTLDSYDEERIISAKAPIEKTFDIDLIEIWEKEGFQQFKTCLNQYFTYLFTMLHKSNDDTTIFDKFDISCDNQDELHFVEHGFFDMIPQNVFLIDNEYYFFDQEWFEKNLPFEFIVFRTLLYFNLQQKDKTLDDLFDEFNIAKFTNTFWALETKIQASITNKDLCLLNSNANANIFDSYHALQKEFADLKNLVEQQKNVIDEQGKSIHLLLAQNEELRNRNVLRRIYRKMKGRK